jgi:hypothetical protein
VETFKERLAVNKQNSFAALEDLDTEVEINSAWETNTENINISTKAYRSLQIEGA